MFLLTWSYVKGYGPDRHQNQIAVAFLPPYESIDAMIQIATHALRHRGGRELRMLDIKEFGANPMSETLFEAGMLVMEPSDVQRWRDAFEKRKEDRAAIARFREEYPDFVHPI